MVKIRFVLFVIEHANQTHTKENVTKKNGL